MKKKIAVLFLASILALSAAACNSGSSNANSKVESAAGTSSTASVVESNSESTASTADSDVDVKNLFQTNYVDVIKDGKFYMQMTMDTASLVSSDETSGVPEKLTMVMAADTPNQKLYIDMGYSIMGFQKIMVSDGKQYMIDDANKTAYYMTATDDVQSTMDSMAGGIVGTTDGVTYVSDSVETFNDKECYAVVYKVEGNVSLAEGVSLASSSGLETEQTYYFDKSTKALSGIKVKNGSVDSIVVIDKLTKELPADLFTIPSDYTQTDMSSMMSAAAE